MPTLGRRRALGQHFLKDQGICRTIAEKAISEAKANGCSALLEIGPGKGAITYPLLDLSEGIEKFIICERDRQIAAHWIQESQKEPDAGPKMEVKDSDFLELPEAVWLSQTPLQVVSNLPYSAGTAIFTRLARHPEAIPSMVLMFQAEVAQRLRAEPSTHAWGSLSVWTQNIWDVKKLLSVPPHAFAPPPEVDSEVVVVTRRTTPRIPATLSGKTSELWEPLLKACFAHRRKMLRSGLPPSGPFRNALERSGVDGTKRAEALTWDEWNRLVEALSLTE